MLTFLQQIFVITNQHTKSTKHHSLESLHEVNTIELTSECIQLQGATQLINVDVVSAENDVHYERINLETDFDTLLPYPCQVLFGAFSQNNIADE